MTRYDQLMCISPPDTKNPKWCAGALALNIPHTSIKDLLTIQGTEVSLEKAFEYYYSRSSQDNDENVYPIYDSLHQFFQNETDLFNATNVTKNFPIHLQNKKGQQEIDILREIYPQPDSDDIEEPFQNDYTDFDLNDIENVETHKNTCISLKNCKERNGIPTEPFLSTNNPWATFQNEKIDQEVMQDTLEIEEDHKSFMDSLVQGKNPESTQQNIEVEKNLLYAKGDRKTAAQLFLDAALQDCKNKEQRYAIETVTSILDAYYFGNYTSKIKEESVQSTPVMVMIGVPGAGKSWIIGKLRTWVDIRFNKDDLPFKSSEYATMCTKDFLDPVTKNLHDSIRNLPEGAYGKSIALAFSGSAAGVIKGFTIHHGFSFPVNLNKRIKDGEIPLPELTNTARTKLLNLWSSIKFVIIDEVYTLKVEWLSLIDEKLRQVFNSNMPFAGMTGRYQVLELL